MVDEMGHAGIVDEHIEPAEACVDRLHHAGDLGIVTDVAGDEQRLTPFGLDEPYRLAGIVFAPGVVDDDVETELGKAKRTGPPDAGRGTGHESHTSIPGFRHVRTHFPDRG